jgi:hypothetical protein
VLRATPTSRAPRLSSRALNRALLARQLLLDRSPRPVLGAVEDLVGLQAQTPLAPYLSLWSRLHAFDPAGLAELLQNRQVVRISLMRSTIHLVSAADCRTMRPLVQTVGERGLRANFGRHLVGLEPAEIEAAGRAALRAGPLTFAQLGAVLAECWPGRDPSALAYAVRTYVPLVQVPPRGLWGKGGLARHVPAESWLGAPLAAAPALEDMVSRYLGAFGPASVADAQLWSGLTGLGEILDRLRPRLACFRDPAGRELFDLPDAPRPAADAPAPPRFLPVFDNLLLSHADRSRVLGDDLRGKLPGTAALMAGTVLADGSVAAAWEVRGKASAARLVVSPLVPVTAAQAGDIQAEGAALLAFLVPEADRAEVDIEDGPVS